MRILIIAVVFALAVLPGRVGADNTVLVDEGWNLVAWTADSVAVEEIADGTTAIYGWNGDSFTRYLTDGPANTLTELETGEAYWILSTMPIYINEPKAEPTPCPTCAEPCPEPTPCPECAVSYEWECMWVRTHGMGMEVNIEFCEGMGFQWTYEKEELANIETYLDEHCR